MNRNNARAIAVVACAVLLIVVWQRRKGPLHPPTLAQTSAAASGAKVLRGKPRSTTELVTTNADIYLGNLDGQIEELTRLTKDRP